MSTRGSFTSDQAVKGFEMLQKYEYQKLHKDYTYLFEIIYDDNRIVVKYDYEDLILLGMIHTKTGYEVDLYGEGNDVRLKNLITNLGFKVVRKYDGINDYSILKGMIKDDEEGFVVRFSNGDRMKIKGEGYLRFRYGKFGDKDPEPTKKEFAEFLSMNNYNPIIKALCFAMWDKKDYDKIIWKHIKPEFRKL
jgi:hypothetical protein